MSFIGNLLGKCEKCGHSFAVKKSAKTVVMKEDIKIFESLTQPNPKGGVDRMVEGFVPGERIYYREESKCKFCGDTQIKYTTKDVKKV